MAKGKPGVPVKTGDGTYAWMQNDQGGWGFNNLGLVQSRGQSLMIDTTSDEPLTRQAIKDWRAMDPDVKQIDILFITHQHWDHVAGMCAPEFEGARIIASDSVDDYLADFPNESWLARMRALEGIPRKQFDEWLGHGDYFDFKGNYTVHPTETFTGTYEFKVGDEKVEIFENPQSHSPSDSLVHVPGKVYVHMGDLTSRKTFQSLQHPGMQNAINGIKLLIKWGAKTYVPGHGALCSLEDLKEKLECCEWQMVEARKLYDKGMTFEEATDTFIKNIKNGPFKDFRGARSTYWTMKMMFAEFAGNTREFMRRNNTNFLTRTWENEHSFEKKYPGVL